MSYVADKYAVDSWSSAIYLGLVAKNDDVTTLINFNRAYSCQQSSTTTYCTGIWGRDRTQHGRGWVHGYEKKLVRGRVEMDHVDTKGVGTGGDRTEIQSPCRSLNCCLYQIFDTAITVGSFVLDLVFIEQMSSSKGEETIVILIVFLLWRVLRLVNGKCCAVCFVSRRGLIC